MRSLKIVAVKLHRGWERLTHCRGDLINWEERIPCTSVALRVLFPTFPPVSFYFKNNVNLASEYFIKADYFALFSSFSSCRFDLPTFTLTCQIELLWYVVYYFILQLQCFVWTKSSICNLISVCGLWIFLCNLHFFSIQTELRGFTWRVHFHWLSWRIICALFFLFLIGSLDPSIVRAFTL